MASGSIRKRKTRKGYSYQVTIEASPQDKITGERYRIYKTFRSYREASSYMTTTIYNLNHGCYADARSVSFKELAVMWLETKKISLKKSTLSRYTEQLDWYILPALGKYPLNAVTVDVLQQFINNLFFNRKLSAKTVKNVFNNVKTILDYAITKDILIKNPCGGVNLPKIEEDEVKPYSEQEIQKILECAKNTDLYFPVFLLIGTGLRKGELLGLIWKNVNIDNSEEPACIDILQTRLSVGGKEHIETPKTKGSRRRIYLSENVRREFLVYRKWCEQVFEDKQKALTQEDFVIIRADGKTDSPTNFTRRFHRFLKSNNIRDNTVHALRHTNATQLLNAGVDIKTISKRLGHSDAAMLLKRYGHSLDSAQLKAASALDDVLKAS